MFYLKKERKRNDIYCFLQETDEGLNLNPMRCKTILPGEPKQSHSREQ